MQVNNVTIPDAGLTREYIPDAIGGWMYIVTTTVSVEQKNLGDFQAQFEEAKERLVDAQAEVDRLTPIAANFKAALPDEMPAEITSATSTPAT